MSTHPISPRAQQYMDSPLVDERGLLEETARRDAETVLATRYCARTHNTDVLEMLGIS